MSTLGLLLILLAVYALFTVFWLTGWILALQNKQPLLVSSELKATLLIPYRNEARRILPILEFIIKYQSEISGVEFVFINDHSTDETEQLIKAKLGKLSTGTLLSLPGELIGKKNALTYGIEKSRHEIILTTDADCLPSLSAIQQSVAWLQSDKIQLVCGPVIQHSGPGFFSRLVDLEFLSLMASGISFWGLGFPFLCNGAFLGFKKSIFLELNGYSDNAHFPGGDDVFILHKIKSAFGKKAIHFLTDPEHLTQTEGDLSASTFFTRRIRWGAKARAYDAHGKRITFFILFQSVLFAAFSLYLLFTGNFSHLFFLLAGKTCLDIFILAPPFIHFRKYVFLPFILPASFFHSFYIATTGFLSIWVKYSWKERKY